jgi:hypothetical protein
MAAQATALQVAGTSLTGFLSLPTWYGNLEAINEEASMRIAKKYGTLGVIVRGDGLVLIYLVSRPAPPATKRTACIPPILGDTH